MPHAADTASRQPEHDERARRPGLGPAAAALCGLALSGLLATGCGGGGSPAVANVSASTTTTTVATTAAATTQGASVAGGSPSGGSSTAPRGSGNHTVMMVGNPVQGAKFAACVRRHGVPGFPDPDAQGTIAFGSGIDPRSQAFRSALNACKSLLPPGFGQPPTAAQLQRVQQQLLAFSQCMRAHGLADFPDPSGAALPELRQTGDLDPNNPQFRAAYGACKSHLPAGVPAKALGGLTPPAGG
jgi:hypothetical protein